MSHTSTPSGARTADDHRRAWATLTWDDLSAWAGGKSLERGRGYQRSGHVSDLAMSADGKLLAWVRGTERYATTVELLPEETRQGRLRSRCTCPVGADGCKHAVAVVLAALDAIKKNTPIPEAPASDRRWRRIEDDAPEDWDDDEEEEFGDEDFAEEGDEEEDFRPLPRRRHEPQERAPEPPPKKPSRKQATLRAFLETKAPADLVALLLDLAERYPEVGQELNEKRALLSGQTAELIKEARKEIRRVTAEPSWVNHWTGEGEQPDYGGLKRRFENLLEHGEADALLGLGKELLERGQEQVGQSDDEGETASDVAACLEVVFRAVPRSSLSRPQQILYAIDAVLEDDYDLCAGADTVLDAEYSPEDWSAVADELANRLRSSPKPKATSEFSGRYRRENLSRWLMDALDSAGRPAEALAVAEEEARATGTYERLVKRLIADGRLDDAERWAREGIAKTQRPWPGIAKHLRDMLREIAEKRKDWPLVAAYHAEDFFDYPSVAGLKTLLKAAAKAGCEDAVRAAALHFLEAGRRPRATTPTAGAVTAGGKTPRRRAKAAAETSTPAAGPAWPLPLPTPTASGEHARPHRDEPFFDVLLDLAIAEKRPDDVLKWYERLQAGRSRSPWGRHLDEGTAVRVADAVADSHPERALDVYRKLALKRIAETSPRAYEEAAVHLRKVRRILTKLGRDAEWKQLLATIRADNARKRRLLEVLDGLEGRPIIEG